MNEKEKQEYLEGYQKAKEKGVPFFPDILFKDALVSLIIFVVLIALAYFLGAPLEDRANPADTSYTPRPEWYFLFLFQLLKYFPGKLEVIGVIIIPAIVIILLFGLPFIDRSARRHFLGRPVVTGATSLVFIGVILLTIQAVRETPPPSEQAVGDPTAALYLKNCASCHGTAINVPKGTNLHSIIAQGKHEGMPSWSADLSSDQIDALAGFILSPQGSQIFNQYCGNCHQATDLTAGNPIQLQNALEQGADFTPHKGVETLKWTEVLSPEERTSLLNFLIAPDGQRLFATNCSPCHGFSVPFSGNENELRAIISKGGLHLDMPAWKGKLNDEELAKLSQYVVDPANVPEGKDLFKQYCSNCHGENIPKASDVDQARQIIASGGPHQTMPVWGQVLTTDQIDALIKFTLDSAKGTSVEKGEQLFSQNCAPCHGNFGEGGPNPAHPGDIIAPISSAEFLKTRDDFTLAAIISNGQPSFGMSPFGIANGGQLEDTEIEAIVAFIRSWEAKPPVEFPPEIPTPVAPLKGPQIYASLCAQCHGNDGEGTSVGPSLQDPKFQDATTDQDMFNSINLGHKATPMIAWGEILTSDQITQLVKIIRQFRTEKPQETQEAPSFAKDVLPIFEQNCQTCHGNFGGWDASSYQTVMTTGEHGPVVIPGDSTNSLLAKKLLGTQEEGAVMPPSGKLADDLIQIILDWIAAGASDN